MCLEFHCLPGPGGWLDQDSFVAYGMDLTMVAIKAKEQMDQHQAELKRGR
jgi:hypothetical protein